jgi:hypothetical protein
MVGVMRHVTRPLADRKRARRGVSLAALSVALATSAPLGCSVNDSGLAGDDGGQRSMSQKLPRDAALDLASAVPDGSLRDDDSAGGGAGQSLAPAGNGGAGGTAPISPAGAAGSGGSPPNSGGGDRGAAGGTGAAGAPGAGGGRGGSGGAAGGASGMAGSGAPGGPGGATAAGGSGGAPGVGGLGGGSVATGGAAGSGMAGAAGRAGSNGGGCNPTSCANGCCAGNECVRTPSAQQCGLMGGTCMRCSPCDLCTPRGQCALDPMSPWTIVANSAQLMRTPPGGGTWDPPFGDEGGPAPDPFCEFENPARDFSIQTAGVTSTVPDAFSVTWNQVITPAGVTISASALTAPNPAWRIWVGDEDCASPGNCGTIGQVVCSYQQPISPASLESRQLALTNLQGCASLTLSFVCQAATASPPGGP